MVKFDMGKLESAAGLVVPICFAVIILIGFCRIMFEADKPTKPVVRVESVEIVGDNAVVELSDGAKVECVRGEDGKYRRCAGGR